jgi:hypothetical protein
VLELRRIRAIVADLTADIPAAAPFPSVEAVERAIDALATDIPGVEVRPIGVARDDTLLRAIGIAPSQGSVAPGLLVAVPRGDSPVGAQTLLTLARRLGADPTLRVELGVRWWLVPCLDPAGARRNAARWRAPLTLDGYARGIVPSSPADRPDAATEFPPPEQHALLDLIAAERPRATLFLYDAPSGGFALFARRGDGSMPWRERDGDFFRFLDPLGLPLDLGGALGPVAAALAPGTYPLAAPSQSQADPYARFRAELVSPISRALWQFGPPDMAIGAVVAPHFIDYERRERDRTLASVTRRAVVAEGIRLWREWFAFGRTALELVAPYLPMADLERSSAHIALLAALRGADTILAEGLRWPVSIPDADALATSAETFAHGDVVRLARLPRLAALVHLLNQAVAHLAPNPPEALTNALDRALDTQTRWIDELAAPDALRPLPCVRAIAAQLGAILLALP